MRRTAIAALLGAVVGVAAPACDLVFAPGRGPGASADAGTDAADGDGPPAGDGQPIDASIDAPPGTPDASPADAACSAVYTCYTVDLAPGFPAAVGVAGCETDVDDVCTNYPDLVPIDMCSCTAGAPEIYIQLLGPTIQLAFLAPPPFTGMWSVMANDNGLCLGGDASCTHDGPCLATEPLFVWGSVPINPGSTNTIAFYVDDGSGCSVPMYTLTVDL